MNGYASVSQYMYSYGLLDCYERSSWFESSNQ